MDTTTRIRQTGPCPLCPSVLWRGMLGAAALTAAVMLVGCRSGLSSLAAGDPFLAFPAAMAEQIGFEAGFTIANQKELLEIQRDCGAKGASQDLRGKPGMVCQAQPSGFYGRSAEAYRRWAEDRVRELPAPSETASSAGG